jgi:hypothetical protein
VLLNKILAKLNAPKPKVAAVKPSVKKKVVAKKSKGKK